MSKKSNPTLIGAFVVGAAVLLAVSVAIFGGSELLAKRQVYVAYFIENTQGLRTGSTVMLNGVHIGHVSGVALLVDRDSYQARTEVIIEILPDAYIVLQDGEPISDDLAAAGDFEDVITTAGLRAVLQVESFVTGQLLIELDFRPDTEPVLRGSGLAPYAEIPTIPSQTQEMLAKVRDLIGDLGEAFDINTIGEYIENTLKGLDELTNSEDLRESLAGLNKIINQNETQNLTATLQATLNDLREVANDASTLIGNGNTKLDSLQPVIDNMVTVLDEAQATLNAAKVALQGESAEFYQLGTTLQEVEAAARALREFLDYLEQNPEALLRGKQ